MPFIDCKISVKLDDKKKEVLKAELGKNIGILRKPESYLMVGIIDNYDLYFAGKKLEKGAYVGVKVFGGLNKTDCANMTKAICGALKNKLDIPADCVYITYEGIENWGFDGYNF